MQRNTKLTILVVALLLATLLAACGADAPTATVPAAAQPPVHGGYTGPAANILISADDLAEMLGDVPTLRIVDFGSKAEYAAGHIPDAINLTWDQFNITNTDPASIATWQANVATLLGKVGIAATDSVVVYDHGDLYGARLWWVLDQLGHADKKILDGGYAAWVGGPTSTKAPSYPATTYVAKPKSSVLASAADVQNDLGKPGIALVDARAPDEYSGQNADGTPRGGHIPGAVNVPFTTVATDSAPKLFKSADQLKAMYAAQGVTTDQSVIAYCTTGVRGSVDYVSLLLAGFKDVRVYTGSWAEWGPRADLPITK